MRFYSRLLILLLPLALTTLVLAQSSEPGYTALFDGRDLTGWRYGKDVLHKQTETPDKRFYVSNGILVLAAKDKDGKKDQRSLVTVREFSRDFQLKLEFKAANESVGSISVRNLTVPVADFRRRAEYPGLTKFKTDDWNEITVTVRKTHNTVLNNRGLTSQDKVEVTIENGMPVVKLNGAVVDTMPLHFLVDVYVSAWSECNGQSLVGTRAIPRGVVSLNSNSGKIEFRNIRFKELP